ncbi:Uncharacterised protein [Klebsiella pneumoniae]|nr:Uncharacterised protein [Klebsiella pneumoniae]VTM02595.1 Uncharacterised protein [Klebsiella pneumoniae]
MTAPAEKIPDGGAWRLIRATLWCRIFAGWQLRLTRPGDLALNSRPSQARASVAPPGKDSRRGAAFVPGGGCDLPGLRSVRLVVNLFTIVAETAGAGGLKIAETFPEGRGSPHGCGLRAVFCTDAASARPEACRDKSKAPRSGDFAGRSPEVQGAAATGRPLCAPCAMPGITQKINRERKIR